MIKIDILKDKEVIHHIKISGHAHHSDYGQDIVCAAVSSIAISSINGILAIDKASITYQEDGYLEIKNIKKDEITNKLLNNMVNMLSELQNDYPNNIRIRKEELA